MKELALYDKACRALAEAVSVDEVMKIRIEVRWATWPQMPAAL